MKARKMLIFSSTQGDFVYVCLLVVVYFRLKFAMFKYQLMTIFTSKKFGSFRKLSADKIQYKKYKGIKVLSLMPIRVEGIISTQYRVEKCPKQNKHAYTFIGKTRVPSASHTQASKLRLRRFLEQRDTSSEQLAIYLQNFQKILKAI